MGPRIDLLRVDRDAARKERKRVLARARNARYLKRDYASGPRASEFLRVEPHVSPYSDADTRYAVHCRIPFDLDVPPSEWTMLPLEMNHTWVTWDNGQRHPPQKPLDTK